MITLFGTLTSGNVYKVQLLFAHLGVAYRRVDVSQPRGEPATPAYRAVNPIGKVPAVLLEDGRMLSESGAILYRFSVGTPYWPQDIESQTEVLRWMFFEQYSHEPAIAVNRYLLLYSDDDRETHGEAVARNHVRGMHALSVMEGRLVEGDWLAGSDYSIADMALYAYTHNAGEAGFDLAAFPALRAWIARIEAQPGFVPMFADGAAESLSFADYFDTAP